MRIKLITFSFNSAKTLINTKIKTNSLKKQYLRKKLKKQV